jgi:hypothetical protein
VVPPPALLTILVFLTVSIVAGQVQQESASSLIEFLNRGQYARDQFGRRVKVPIEEELAHCSDRGNRGAAVSLAKLGGTSLPLLEEALDSIEKRALQSVYAHGTGWLSIVYARNMGPAAVPRLRRLIGNPKLVWFQVQLDHSVALALGLTSYVTESSEGPFQCRLQEPRDGLDRLILGWKQNNRQTIENNLGPNARAALKLLLDGRDLEAMRAELWVGKSGGGSVGYRFGIPGRWSEPEETLELEKAYPTVTIRELLHAELATHFKNRSGDDCGSQRVAFLKTVEVNRQYVVGKRQYLVDPLQYLVDNSDLEELLRLIATCAASK